MTVKIEIFTSPTCPNCPPAKNLVRDIGKEVEDVRVVETTTATKQGSRRAQSLHVLAVPTIFVTGPEFDRMGFRGMPPKQRLLDAIAIAKGEKQWEEPKTLMQKLKQKLEIFGHFSFRKIKEKIPIKIKF
ncbi:MAG: glutaredoxin domain-containing protein [archaeon]